MPARACLQAEEETLHQSKTDRSRSFDSTHCMIESTGKTCLQRHGIRLSLTTAVLAWMESVSQWYRAVLNKKPLFFKKSAVVRKPKRRSQRPYRPRKGETFIADFPDSDDEKAIGKPDAGKPHVRFDEGEQTGEVWLVCFLLYWCFASRHSVKAMAASLSSAATQRRSRDARRVGLSASIALLHFLWREQPFPAKRA